MRAGRFRFLAFALAFGMAGLTAGLNLPAGLKLPF